LKHFTTISAIFILAILLGCSDSKSNDEFLEAKAKSITGRLDSNSIKVFYNWNLFMRGVNWWQKISGDSVLYKCGFSKKGNKSVLLLIEPISSYESITHFASDFKCKFEFDTARYWRWELQNSSNIIRMVGTNKHGQDTVLLENKSVSELFDSTNPFNKFASLTMLKDSLNVYDISTGKCGKFIQFRLSAQHILTYLPNNLTLKFKCKNYWEKEFSKGKQIGMNWNFRKLESPIYD
jgi:hypothetical protein